MIDLSKSSTPVQIAVAIVCVLAGILLFSWLMQTLRNAATGGSGGAVRRTSLVLCGPQFSGKTRLFQALVLPGNEVAAQKQTHTSMKVNAGQVKPADVIAYSEKISGNNSSSNDKLRSMRGFEVVDCPGHLRLFDLALDAFRSAKVICIVVDGCRAQDSDNGAASVASLLVTILTAKEAAGVSQILVACNKRDEVASFSSKAMQKLTERELKQRLSQKGAAAGGTGAGVGAGGKQLKKSEILSLDENGEFSWDLCPKPVSFCDISALAPSGKFALDPLLEAML